jgi:hypothetical protein
MLSAFVLRSPKPTLRALDQGYLSRDEFDAIYAQAELTHAKVGGFIRYLLSAPSPSSLKPGTKNP